MIRKTDPQSKWVSSHPATRGPSGSPRKVPTPAIATARGRSFSEKIEGRMAWIRGRITAPLAPISARITIRPSAVVIWLAMTEEAPNRSRPTISIRRRPSRSARTPAGSIRPASARV